MPYRYRLWSGNSDDPVIDMIIRSPNKDHAKFVTRNLHNEYFFNAYIPPGAGMQNSVSKLEEIQPKENDVR